MQVLPRSGPQRKDRALSVNIPAGVETGTRIRLSGEGEAGLRGGSTGDLYIFIEVDEHEIFQRDSINLYCRVPVSMVTAAGGDIEVPSIDGGRSRVKVPMGSNLAARCACAAKVCQRFALVRLAICSLNCPLKHPSI